MPISSMIFSRLRTCIEEKMLIILDCTNKCEKNGQKVGKKQTELSTIESTGHRKLSKLWIL